ncbi:MAG: DUF2891 family protein [Gemmatimonadetes bacterium]|nr:DUF2891 family protein [Gemmatimonadota bacterium]
MLSTSNHTYPAMHQFARTSKAGTSRALLAGLVLAWAACAPDAPERPDDADAHAAAPTPAAGSESPDDGTVELTATSPASGDAPSTPATLPIPTGPPPSLNLETALTVLAGPLSCIDRPQPLPAGRTGYLDVVTYTRRPGFEEDLAFYGCWDWHSAVNSTWAMVRMAKEMPELPVAALIREKLGFHITARSMQGELEYLAANPTFERPYGWVWLLLLHAELASWDDPQAEAWAEHMEPAADLVAERLERYLQGLRRAVRSGTHRSTAFTVSMGLRATAMYPRRGLERVLRDTAVRFFAGDDDCDVEDEPGRSDFLSPCLEEAALMAEVMDPDDYVPWLDSLLPHMDSADFAPLRTSALTDSTGDRGLEGMVEAAFSQLVVEGSGMSARMRESIVVSLSDTTYAARARRSHLISLAFGRADAMLRIAAALPATDPRVGKLRELAAQHGRTGLDTMFNADYAGSHWISSFAVKYLVEVGREDDP